MSAPHATWAALGLGVDRLLGEPPTPVHPVAAFGGAMARLERCWYRDTRAAGSLHAAAGLALGVGSGLVLRRAVGRPAATVMAVAVASAGRMLEREALAVADLLDRPSRLEPAPTRLAGLVGRDTSGLDEAGISRAAIETLAENTVDAAIATMWWGAVGGAPAAFGHRALNTLDAMVGHRSDRYRRFGWASARLDDAAAWVPARIAVASVMVARPGSARAVWRIVRRDAGAHPSPNGGVVEAAFAAALGVRLGGTNRYGDGDEHRGVLGDGPPPTANDVRAAVRLARAVTAVAAVATIATAATARAIIRRSRRPPG